MDQPYQGVQREPSIPNLWFGAIPHTVVEGRTAGCAYWIFETTRTIRFDSITMLNLPT